MKRFLMIALMVFLYQPVLAATDKAIFAGGCFWCMEKPFDQLDGVLSTTSGYTGGHTENPSYKSTSTGRTGHYEALEVIYDPAKISYKALLKVFWKNIDLFDDRGQFCDKGPQYKAAIFANSDAQRLLAIKSKQALQRKLKDRATIVTEILSAKQFYAAEDYHQDYYLKNPIRYKFYRYNCGRDKRLGQIQKIVGGE